MRYWPYFDIVLKMWSLICLQLLVAAAGQVHGIELSLTAVHDADMCGKVRCVDTTSNGDSMKNLTIRKQLDTGVVLVEMSQQQPSFTSNKDDRTTKGIWAMGGLSLHGAVVEISLYNTDDCSNAEFICETVQVNKLGVERVNSSSASSLKSLTKAFIKSQQLLTTCPRDENPPQHNRYQVVYPTDGTPSYLCDTHGGWTVIQRRIDDKTDFYRNWSNYKDGFRSHFKGNIWLGLERIHQISSSSNQELMVTIMLNGMYYHAHYDNFMVSGEEDNYRLSIGAYTGTAGDSLLYHNNKPFSTYDKDNDTWDKGSCAQVFHGAWWYDSCNRSNLNGKWGGGRYIGPTWGSVTNKAPATMTEMKIRKMI